MPEKLPYWRSFNVPDSLIGEKHASESTYVTTYQTEVLLPKDSPYEGYCFLHPSKLISEKAGGFTSITFNPDFTFTLIKKDREPGKRYKRYKLTANEIVQVYEEEFKRGEQLRAKVEEKQRKKEEKRRARLGSVDFIEIRSDDGYDLSFLFHHGEKDYTSTGAIFKEERSVLKRQVLVESISQGSFEDVFPKLYDLAHEYGMIEEVRQRLAHPRRRYHHRKLTFGELWDFKETATSAAISDSFKTICDTWEAEFIKKAKAIMKGE